MEKPALEEDEGERRYRLKVAGAHITKAREERDDLRGRTPEEVRALRETTAKSATVCGCCFQPLAPTASVTMVGRPVTIPPRPPAEGPSLFPGLLAAVMAHRGPPRPRQQWLRVPICLLCWLTEIRGAGRWWGWTAGYERLRCLGCGRPMRVKGPETYHRRYELFINERCCCDDCLRKVTNERARLRRRVIHKDTTCEVCGKTFTPKRSDAVTCSNKCRQRLFRLNHR